MVQPKALSPRQEPHERLLEGAIEVFAIGTMAAVAGRDKAELRFRARLQRDESDRRGDRRELRPVRPEVS
jgi:hypothetical protein